MLFCPYLESNLHSFAWKVILMAKIRRGFEKKALHHYKAMKAKLGQSHAHALDHFFMKWWSDNLIRNLKRKGKLKKDQ